jgi:hypothetical protein
MEPEAEEKMSNVTLYSVMILMLAFGTINTVVMKMQDDTIVGKNADGTDQKFTHPYLQCAIMMLGEILCLIIYGMKNAYYGSS